MKYLYQKVLTKSKVTMFSVWFFDIVNSLSNMMIKNTERSVDIPVHWFVESVNEKELFI